MLSQDNHKKVISLVNHSFHYGICKSCGDEIILSEYPKFARVKQKCTKCQFLKRETYQKEYKRKAKKLNDKCKACNKDIVRTNQFRISTGMGSHYYFCDKKCKENYKSIREKEASNNSQSNLDPKLVAQLLEQYK